MNTYLFVWNPNHSTLDIENRIKEVNETGSCTIKWSSGVNKSINIRDRAFFIRVGEEPKGIIGSGL